MATRFSAQPPMGREYLTRLVSPAVERVHRGVPVALAARWLRTYLSLWDGITLPAERTLRRWITAALRDQQA